MLWNVAKFTQQDADVLESHLHHLLVEVITQYVRKVKTSVLNYSNINLSWTSGAIMGPVHILIDNYWVGEIYMAVAGTSWKVHANRSAYHTSKAGEMSPTTTASKVVKYMISECVIPTPEEDEKAMKIKVKENLRIKKHDTWRDLIPKFNAAIGANRPMDGFDHTINLVSNIASLMKLSEGELTPTTLKNSMASWIDSGVFDAYEEYVEIDTMIKLFNVGDGFMFVREWSDGSGAIVKTEGAQVMRYICKNLYEEMPAEHASKLAMLKVSGLNFIADAGIRCDPTSARSDLTETVYCLI